MGLLRRDEPDGTRLLMREKLLSVGDDSWVQDESGDNIYKVNGKKLRVQETFVLEDPSGNEVLHIQARDLRMRGVMKIERNGNTVATVTKKVIGIRDRFSIDLEHGAGTIPQDVHAGLAPRVARGHRHARPLPLSRTELVKKSAGEVADRLHSRSSCFDKLSMRVEPSWHPAANSTSS